MVDDETDNQADDGSDDASGDDASSRRSLLKKAAFAPIIAGAVWVAPKVEHLSLVPDVAAAQSGATPNGPFTVIVGADGLPVSTSSGVLTVGTSQSGPNPGLPTVVDILFNSPGGPCTFANINAVDANIGGDPVPLPIVNQSGGHADLQWITDVPYNLATVTFDLLCT